MTIRIHNSLTQKKEDFKPIKKDKVGMYSCGVTVYDHCHLGHARSLFIFDYIKKYLAYRGFKVKFIRNVTDIDDKIINKAREQGKSTAEVAEKYIKSYKEDIQALGIGEADKEPRATKHIEEIKEHIKKLLKEDYAYEKEGDVYFRVRKFKEYGKLSHQSLEQIQAGSRIETNEKKENPLDFALWKNSKEDEPFWDSPWGKGRPGWHIECSAMSMRYLGDTFDIHAGGRDLIFPHHENEIAQSEAKTGKPFVKYWIHHGLLTINGQKMAKSLGNFVTIKDVLKKYDPNIIKLFFLSSHYSQPIDFNKEKMEETKKAYERINILMTKLDRKYGTRDVSEKINGDTGAIGQFRDEFIKCMDDDFNTPKALAVLYNMVNKCHITFDGNDRYKDLKLSYAMSIIKEIADIFGLTFIKEASSEISDDKIQWYISARNALKKEKKYKEADEIREKLDKKGIILEDAKDGTTWRRKI